MRREPAVIELWKINDGEVDVVDTELAASYYSEVGVAERFSERIGDMYRYLEPANKWIVKHVDGFWRVTPKTNVEASAFEFVGWEAYKAPRYVPTSIIQNLASLKMVENIVSLCTRINDMCVWETIAEDGTVTIDSMSEIFSDHTFTSKADAMSSLMLKKRWAVKAS